MNKKIILVFFVTFVKISSQAKEKNDYYNAAVVEFSPNENGENNIHDYEWFIKQAKAEGVDIIVFPEYALYKVNGDIENKSSEIPNPKDMVIPCRHTIYQQWEMIEKLSCVAQENTIYVVVNLLERVPCNASESNCPEKGRRIYNTDIVFDRKGEIIARYRKFHIHNELYVESPEQPELQTFDTDFGVRFGMFTSFDIMFRSPAVDLVEKYNVTNFVYPTRWSAELPFLTGLQIQNGWSYTMNVNLLAAGTNQPSSGAGGSGIYIGKRGPLIFSMPECEASTALISKVPKNVRTTNIQNSDLYSSTIKLDTKNSDSGDCNGKKRLYFGKDPTVGSFESVVLKESETEFKDEICSGSSLCCRFKVSYKKNKESEDLPYVYRAIAYQGARILVDNMIGWVENCAIILCSGPSLDDCTVRPEPSFEYQLVFSKISIEAKFSNNGTIQMPNILLGSDLPLRKTKMVLLGSGHYDFRTKDEGTTRTVKMVLKDEQKSVMAFGIYSRDFIRSGASTINPLTCLFFVVWFFVLCFK